MTRPVRVYRLDIVYPPGSDAFGWAPDGWDPTEGTFGEDTEFRWPNNHLFLSRSGADSRARRLREWGATVDVVPSDPVVWP